MGFICLSRSQVMLLSILKYLRAKFYFSKKWKKTLQQWAASQSPLKCTKTFNWKQLVKVLIFQWVPNPTAAPKQQSTLLPRRVLQPS